MTELTIRTEMKNYSDPSMIFQRGEGVLQVPQCVWHSGSEHDTGSIQGALTVVVGAGLKCNDNGGVFFHRLPRQAKLGNCEASSYMEIQIFSLLTYAAI